MTPFMQTKFGKGQGNCLQACVASILDLSLKHIPDFNKEGMEWFVSLVKWCDANNVGVLYLPGPSVPACILANFYLIATYKVAESVDEEHAVVCRADYDLKKEWVVNVVHDPNPKAYTLTELTGLIALIHR